jgi:uncharacterized protein involved in exopolysaccharide biosynthesis
MMAQLVSTIRLHQSILPLCAAHETLGSMTQIEIPSGVTLPGAMRPPNTGPARPVSVLVRSWRLVAALTVLSGAVALIISQFLPRTYTASTSFLPETPSSRLSSSLLGMTDLAGQFGISIGGDANRSPRFYADVINSRQLTERALLSVYRDPRQGARDSVTLLALLNPKGRTQQDRLADGVRRFRRMMVIQLDAQTGILRLSIRSPYPDLAATIANRYVAAVNDFNSSQRQSQALARRQFIERRLASVERELRTAENDMQLFYERNRKFDQSPQLKLDEDRLRRNLDTHQQVYTTLTREFETARIQEVNDTPVITVIDSAIAVTAPSSPRPSAVGTTAAILGGVLALAFLTGRELLGRR